MTQPGRSVTGTPQGSDFGDISYFWLLALPEPEMGSILIDSVRECQVDRRLLGVRKVKWG